VWERSDGRPLAHALTGFGGTVLRRAPRVSASAVVDRNRDNLQV